MPATSVEQMAYTYYRGVAGLSTSVGGIYWHTAPTGANMPYVTYYQVDDPRPKVFLSEYGGESRLRFDVFDTDNARALTSCQAIIEATRGLRGLNSGLDVTNAVVANVLTQPPTTDDTIHRTVDIIVTYTE